MGQYKINIDNNAINKDALQYWVNQLLSKPNVRSFLETQPGSGDINITITDNKSNPMFSQDNLDKLAGAVARGFSQNAAGYQKLIYLNLLDSDEKSPLNVLVHEIGHSKWTGLGKSEPHSPLFYKILNDSLQSLGISVDPDLDLNKIPISNIPSPAGYKNPLQYFTPGKKSDATDHLETLNEFASADIWESNTSDGQYFDIYKYDHDRTHVTGHTVANITSYGLRELATYNVNDGSHLYQYFDDDTHNFAQSDQYYDAANRLYQKDVFNRDGTYQAISYDVNNSSPFAWIDRQYDQGGNEKSSLIYNDDGTRDYVVDDPYNQNEWRAYSESFNSNGNKTGRYIVSDDGSAKHEIWRLDKPNLPNSPDTIKYFDSSGNFIRQQDSEYGIIAATNIYVLNKTITTDIANVGSWNQIVINYDRYGNARQAYTNTDYGTSFTAIDPQYFTPKWNFASTADSNISLVQNNIYDFFAPYKLSGIDLPLLNTYDPFSYFSNDYVGYKGYDFQGMANTDPYHNVQLLIPNPYRYFDYDTSFAYYGPVVFDLNGDGVQINFHSTSSALFDVDNSGVRHHTAWAGPSDGLLVLDLSEGGDFGPNGKISQLKELNFSGDVTSKGETAPSDLSTLAKQFDTNKDGVFDAQDAHFNDFRVWQDLNSDGVSDANELRSLSDAGIMEINLKTSGRSVFLPDGTAINGLASFTDISGHIGVVADVAFGYGGTDVDQTGGSNSNYAIVKPGADGFYDVTYAEDASFIQSAEISSLSEPNVKPGLVAGSRGFDANYYLSTNPDVAKAALDSSSDTFEFASIHYKQYGWHEGRNPNAEFDTKGYLNAYSDVKAANIDPLAHYDNYGWHEGRDPSLNFDTASYLAANPDVEAAKINPMAHFLEYGMSEGRHAFADHAFS